MEVIFPQFEFVFGPSNLGLGELEVRLAMSLSGDVCGLGATCYMLSMDRKLISIVVVSKRVLCVLKLMCQGIFLISGLVLHHFSYASSYFTDRIDFYRVLYIVYHRVIRIMFGVYKTF